MPWKQSLVGLSYLASVVLGNVCLMDITYAIEPPTPSDPLPISYIDATKCPWVTTEAEKSDAKTETQKSPCESGHCITSPSPEISCFGQNERPIMPVAVTPPQSEDVILTVLQTAPVPETAESPPLVGVTTVVLRM